MNNLIVDGNHMLHRIMRSGFSEMMETEDGIKTGGCFGVLKSLNSVLKKFRPNKCFYVWDRGLSKRRKLLYPEYKAHTEERDEEEIIYYKNFLKQRELLDETFDYLQIREIYLDSTEGDDICYYLSRNLDGKSLIVTSDKDYIPMVNRDVSLYRPIKGESIEYDTCKEQIGYTPKEYLFVKIIEGDPSDNISGVDGVGSKTLENLFEKLNRKEIQEEESSQEIPRIILSQLVHLGAKDSLNWRERKILDHANTVARNLALIDTSLEKFNKEQIKCLHSQTTKEVQFKEEELLKRCSELEFTSFIENFSSWSMSFRRLK